MPLLPPKRGAQNLENRILVGSIVEYEQHGQPALATVVGERKDKWIILNYRGAQLELPAARLWLLPGKMPAQATTDKARAAFLDSCHVRAVADAAEVPLDELWETVRGAKSEVSFQDLAELAFGDNSLEHHLAIRRAVLGDRVYFKRLKTTLEPRSPEVVNELLVQVRAEAAREQERQSLIEAIVKRLRGEDVPLPPAVTALEQYAALGKSAEHAKETLALVDEAAERAGLSLSGHASDRAFQLLVHAGHFTQDENLIFIRLGRQTIFPEDVVREAAGLRPIEHEGTREDLRHLAAYTIDAEETMDLDDALSFERTPTGCIVGIHISDTTAWIAEGSSLEREAFSRATSIYTPDAHVPMLPPSLSSGVLSLVAGEDRLVVSTLVEFDEQYNIISTRITPSLIRVKQRLSYRETDELLCGETESDTVRDLRGLWDITCHREAGRLAAGAMQFSRRDMLAELNQDGTVRLVESTEETPARKLVSELMILANETMARFGAERGIPLIYRAQEPPDVDPHQQGLDLPPGPAREYFQRSFLKRSTTQVTPGPHSGVGVSAYVQATSPIRRAGDMLNQRQIAHALRTGKPLYTGERLTELLGGLEAGLDEASLIQRERNRYFLLKYLRQEKIESLLGTIVKTDGPRPLVELELVMFLSPFHPLGEAKNSDALRKRRGERIRLRIESLDPRNDTLHLREMPPS